MTDLNPCQVDQDKLFGGKMANLSNSPCVVVLHEILLILGVSSRNFADFGGQLTQNINGRYLLLASSLMLDSERIIRVMSHEQLSKSFYTTETKD